LTFPPNHLKDRIQVIIDVRIPNAKYLESLLFERRSPVLVGCFVPDVARAIKLNDQLGVGTVKSAMKPAMGVCRRNLNPAKRRPRN
jgi:hypothetical protein